VNVRKKVFKGTIWGIVSQIINVAFGFLTLILLARWLGPSDYGFIPLTMTVVAILGLFADFGVGHSAARFIVKYSANEVNHIKSILRDSIFFILIFGTLVSSILFIFSQEIALLLNEPGFEIFLKIGAVYLFSSNIVKYTERVFQGFQRIDLSALQITVESIFKIILAIGLVLLGFGAVGAFMGYTISLTLSAFIGSSILYFKFYRKAPNSTKSIRKKLFTYSIPILAINTSILIYMQTDIILLGYFFGTDSVAFYSIPKKIIDSLLIPAFSLGAAVAPAIAYSMVNNKHGIDGKLFYESIKYLVLLTVPIAVGLAILSRPIILILFGNEYSSSIDILRLFALLLLLFSITSISSPVLTYLGKAGMRAKLVGISAILNLLLDFALIPKFGVMGALYATIITFLPFMLSSFRICINECNLRLSVFNSLLIKVALSSLLMGLVVTIFFSNIENIYGLILAISVGAIVYCIIIFILKAITFEEIKTIINKLVLSQSSSVR